MEPADRIGGNDEIIRKTTIFFFWEEQNCSHEMVEVILESNITENRHSLQLSNKTVNDLN
jgi:hypothetical protein